MEKFRTAKVGDKVWCVRFGWGTIYKIYDDEIYGIKVEYINTKGMTQYDSFTFDGKYYKSDINPILFWNEIKLPTTEEDKKPFDLVEFLRENLKPKEFVNDMLNYYLYFDYDSSSWHSLYNEYCERMDTYFKFIGCNITEELNNNMISPKQLRDAYKKLGWL